jgi:hypothetical protein
MQTKKIAAPGKILIPLLLASISVFAQKNTVTIIPTPKSVATIQGSIKLIAIKATISEKEWQPLIDVLFEDIEKLSNVQLS